MLTHHEMPKTSGPGHSHIEPKYSLYSSACRGGSNNDLDSGHPFGLGPAHERGGRGNGARDGIGNGGGQEERGGGWTEQPCPRHQQYGDAPPSCSLMAMTVRLRATIRFRSLRVRTGLTVQMIWGVSWEQIKGSSSVCNPPHIQQGVKKRAAHRGCYPEGKENAEHHGSADDVSLPHRAPQNGLSPLGAHCIRHAGKDLIVEGVRKRPPKPRKTNQWQPKQSNFLQEKWRPRGAGPFLQNLLPLGC